MSFKNKPSYHELHTAAAKGCLGIVENFLDHQPHKVNVIDEHGNTALHRSGHMDVVKCLLQRGADLHSMNKNGDKPLDMMKRRGVDDEVLRYVTHMMLYSEKNHQQFLADQPSEMKNSLNKACFHSARESPNKLGLLNEFANSIGLKSFIILIVILFALSFVSAYVVTVCLSGQLEVIHIDGETVRTEF